MQPSLIIQNGQVISPIADTITHNDIFIRQYQIEKVDGFDELPNENTSVINAENLYVAPGFIDLQVNGGGGHDFLQATSTEIDQIIDFYHQHGTTSLLPTLITNPISHLRKVMNVIQQKKHPSILGVHLEGPFIAEAKRGTHNLDHILKLDIDQLQALVDGYQDFIQIISFAVEQPGGWELLDAIKTFAIPALGHTEASYEQAVEFIERGGRLMTHLFNAMTGLHQRHPGVVGAALDTDIMASLIVDGIHLHPAIVPIVVKSKGIQNICLVTDAMSAAGMGDGDWSLGDVTVHVENNIAKSDGQTLAGSLLTLDQALKNLMSFSSISLSEAVRTVTLNPAKLLGLDQRKGDLKIGYDADIVIFDQDFNIHYTIVMGKVVYAHEAVNSP